MGRWLFLLAGTITAGWLTAAPVDLEKAQKLYNHTNFRGVVELLSPSASNNAAASELVGEAYFMLGEFKLATDSFENAIRLDSHQSTYYHWLGRAYGRRAETSFPLAAPAYATRARANFEKAVALDPKNSEAVNDLFEFYLQAPGFLGGGFDKAAKVADMIAQHDPAEGNFAKARLAEERKDFNSAESYLRRAAELAPLQPGRLLDLAKILAKRGKFEESDSTFQKARQVAPNSPNVLFTEAATYIHSHRKPEEARQLLEKYLASPISPEDPSKEHARKLLRQVSGT